MFFYPMAAVTVPHVVFVARDRARSACAINKVIHNKVLITPDSRPC